MEGQSFENAERGSDWRERKAEASLKAYALISEILEFDTLSPYEQVGALETLIEELSQNNDNRFIAERIGHKIAVIKEMKRHEESLMSLGIAA